MNPNAPGAVGLGDVGPDILATIAPLVGSFRQMCRLREVSVGFRDAVELALHGNVYITPLDVSSGHHVAALRYALRVATGACVSLAAGIYKLEGTVDAYDSDASDDLDEYSGSKSNFALEGLRFCDDKPNEEMVSWKPGKGSLVVEADGITICVGPGKVTIALDSHFDSEIDPLVHVAMVIKAKDVNLMGVMTEGGLSLYLTRDASMTALMCSFGGTATIFGTASLRGCTVRDGQYGGVTVKDGGKLRMENCELIENEMDYLGCEKRVGVGVDVGGNAQIEQTCVWHSDKNMISDLLSDAEEPIYDEVKKMYRCEIKIAPLEKLGGNGITP